MANKTLKRLLHMCALAAIKYSKEFRHYVERKKEEGKHMMSIINAVRNKLVRRAYSVGSNGKPYVESMLPAA